MYLLRYQIPPKLNTQPLLDTLSHKEPSITFVDIIIVLPRGRRCVVACFGKFKLYSGKLCWLVVCNWFAGRVFFARRVGHSRCEDTAVLLPGSQLGTVCLQSATRQRTHVLLNWVHSAVRCATPPQQWAKIVCP